MHKICRHMQEVYKHIHKYAYTQNMHKICHYMEFIKICMDMQKMCKKSAWNMHESMTLYVIAYIAYISSCTLHFPDDASNVKETLFSVISWSTYSSQQKGNNIVHLASTFSHCFKVYGLNVWLMSKLSMSLVTISWVDMLVRRSSGKATPCHIPTYT